MPEVIKTKRVGGILEVTLDRPKANAIDLVTSRLMGETFKEFRDDPDLRVAIVRTAGDKFFCAGWDLKAAADGDAVDSDYGVGGFGGLQELRGLNKPVIAEVNGMAVGGGFELALACDLILASEKAKFADTHARVGILPGWGLSQRLPRLIGAARAKEISLSGNTIGASLAYEWGLVNRVVEPDELLPAARALANDMASCVPHVLVGYKKLIDEGLAMSLPDALAYERSAGVESSKAVTSAELSQRREGVQSRGRKQSKNQAN
jgi:crotonobetainyl-CoA hydratase